MAYGFKNASRFKRRLRHIAPNARKAIRTQLDANAKELTETQKRVAPHEDGVLQDSIRFEDASTDRRIAVTVRAGGPSTTKPIRKSEKGGAPTYDYALAQEFGTEKMPANPFFFPPYRAKRKAFKRRVLKAAKDAVTKSVKAP